MHVLVTLEHYKQQVIILFSKGYKHSNETKRKMSISRIGNKNALGYNHSNEAKEKISQFMKNRKVSKETKQKLSIALKGNQNRLKIEN